MVKRGKSLRVRWTDHALEQVTRRGLPLDLVEETLRVPDRVVPSGVEGRDVAEKKYRDASGRLYLLRVVFEHDAEGMVVVTAYRTSRLSKYWRDAP
jgi:hypothetical protein